MKFAALWIGSSLVVCPYHRVIFKLKILLMILY